MTLRRKLLDICLTFAIAGFLFPAASPAGAAACFARADIVAGLEEDFGAAQAFVGSVAGGQLIAELFVSEPTGRWFLMYSTPDGIACPIMHGSDADTAPPKPAGTPS